MAAARRLHAASGEGAPRAAAETRLLRDPPAAAPRPPAQVQVRGPSFRGRIRLPRRGGRGLRAQPRGSEPGSARRASACRPALMSRWDGGVTEASGRSSPPGRPPAVRVIAPFRCPGSCCPPAALPRYASPRGRTSGRPRRAGRARAAAPAPGGLPRSARGPREFPAPRRVPERGPAALRAPDWASMGRKHGKRQRDSGRRRP